MIDKWIEKLTDDALQEALAKGETGGIAKAIEGAKLPDKWKDEEAANELLADKIGRARFAKPRLVTPLQALNLIPDEKDRDEVEGLISRGVRKTELVPLDHPKPSIKTMEDQLSEMEDF